MFRFQIFGIPVQVQPFFWIVLFFLGGGLREQSWNALGLLEVALFVLAGFLSIMVHELGHALTGKAFGAPTAITLHGFGGYASFPSGSFTRKQNFAVTFAGPAAQIALGLAVLGLHFFLRMPSPALAGFVADLAWISLVWAVINLLPVVPLDGGHLVLSALGPARIEADWALAGVNDTNDYLGPAYALLIYSRALTSCGDATQGLAFIDKALRVDLKHAYVVVGPDTFEENKTTRRLVFAADDLRTTIAACKDVRCATTISSDGLVLDLDDAGSSSYWAHVQPMQYSGSLDAGGLVLHIDKPDRLTGTLKIDNSGVTSTIEFDAPLVKSFGHVE